MPLKHGVSRDVVSSNIKEMMASGRPQRQAIAAALSMKRKSMKKKKMADGGMLEDGEMHDEHMAEGGKLDANARAHIAKKNFALPGGRYPIEDASHARNALARVSQHGSPEEKAKVRAAVHRKYPDMGKADGGVISDDMDKGLMSDDDENANVGLMEHNSLGQVHEDSVESPEYQDAERMLAKHLYEQSEKEEMGYAQGGLVIGDKQMMTGSQPELDWINDGSEEPMSEEAGHEADLEHPVEDGVPDGMGISKEAMDAVMERKKKRRYAMA